MFTEQEIEGIAAICHETNRAYCKTLGDESQVPWDKAPAWQRQSAINGVKFRVANPEATPKDMHDSWMEEKVEAGWKYGEHKDMEAKEHPCIVEYEELPMDQQIKDHLFSNIVKTFTNAKA